MDERAEAIGELYLENRELRQSVDALREQLEAEERCATISGGILSDVCDLVFDDGERAAIHGYKGVKEKIVDWKNRAILAEQLMQESQNGNPAPKIEDEFYIGDEGENEAWVITCRSCRITYRTIFGPHTGKTQEWMREHLKTHERIEKPDPPPVRVIKEGKKPEPPSA